MPDILWSELEVEVLVNTIANFLVVVENSGFFLFHICNCLMHHLCESVNQVHASLTETEIIFIVDWWILFFVKVNKSLNLADTDNQVLLKSTQVEINLLVNRSVLVFRDNLRLDRLYFNDNGLDFLNIRDIEEKFEFINNSLRYKVCIIGYLLA